MSSLVVCSACARHVRRTETSCPFCSAPVVAGPMTAPLQGRLSRAMIVLATTTAVAGCGKEKVPDETTAIAPPYGAVPPDLDASVPEPPPPPPPPPPPRADAGRPDASHPRVVPPYGAPARDLEKDLSR